MRRKTMLSAVTAGLLATVGDTFIGKGGVTLKKIGQKAPSWMGQKKTKKYNSTALRKRVKHTLYMVLEMQNNYVSVGYQ
jgi:hypothetical protein